MSRGELGLPYHPLLVATLYRWCQWGRHVCHNWLHSPWVLEAWAEQRVDGYNKACGGPKQPIGEPAWGQTGYLILLGLVMLFVLLIDAFLGFGWPRWYVLMCLDKETLVVYHIAIPNICYSRTKADQGIQVSYDSISPLHNSSGRCDSLQNAFWADSSLSLVQPNHHCHLSLIWC